MQSIYDVVSLILFVGLAILFLQRSSAKEPDRIPLWTYAVAALGCAAGDILGDAGQAVAAVIVFIALIPFCVVMLRPFDLRRRP